MVGVCNYDRTIHAKREHVWKTLTNSRKWGAIPALAQWFGHVEWLEGEPWHVGSRLLIEHYWPEQRYVRLVVLSFHPPEEFAWIGHDRGLTAHQQVQLEAVDEASCRMTSSMNYASNADIVPVPEEVDPMAERLLRTFLDAIADYSERAPAGARKGVRDAGTRTG